MSGELRVRDHQYRMKILSPHLDCDLVVIVGQHPAPAVNELSGNSQGFSSGGWDIRKFGAEEIFLRSEMASEIDIKARHVIACDRRFRGLRSASLLYHRLIQNPVSDI